MTTTDLMLGVHAEATTADTRTALTGIARHGDTVTLTVADVTVYPIAARGAVRNERTVHLTAAEVDRLNAAIGGIR